METLISNLGLSATCKIMDLQMQTTLTGIFGIDDDLEGLKTPAVLVRLDRLMCGSCGRKLFTQPIKCPNEKCAEVHSLQDDPTAFVLASAVSMSRKPKTLGFSFHSQDIGCTFCYAEICSTVYCQSCISCVTHNNPIFLGYSYDVLDKLVADAFREELNDYDL